MTPKENEKVHKLENTAFFLRSGLPPTLIRHENEAFWKRSPNRKNLKMPGLRFRMDGKIIWTFRNRDNHAIFPARVFPKHKSKTTSDCCVLNYSTVAWKENLWCAFRVKMPFSNFSNVVRVRPFPISQRRERPLKQTAITSCEDCVWRPWWQALWQLYIYIYIYMLLSKICKIQVLRHCS